MGLIKKILGGFLAFLGGIAKVFGLGKKGDFYMELNESAAPTLEAPAAAPKPAPVATENKPQKGKTSKKASKAAQNGKVATEPVAQDKVPVAPPKPTVAAVPQLTNFATDYLVNPKLNRSPRRRPGPSISPFKDMAKQMARRSASMG